MMKLNKKPTSKKFTALLLALVLVAAAGIGGTWAWLKYTTDTVVNTFDGVIFDLELKETFAGDVKEDVYITNTGDVDMYVRVQVIPQVTETTGEDSDEVTSIVAAPIYYDDSSGEDITGGYLTRAVELSDFAITGWGINGTNTNTGSWILIGDYYYYTLPVVAGETVYFFDSAVFSLPEDDEIADGLNPVLIIMAEGIQTNVVETYWTDVTESSGTLSAASGLTGTVMTNET